MQVAHHYFENGIAYFTRRINKTISLSKGKCFSRTFFNLPSLIACANGEVAPFVGHNASVRAARVLANIPADASKLI
jgi:hypothetical protein